MAWYWWVLIAVVLLVYFWAWCACTVAKRADEHWERLRRHVEEKQAAEKRRRLMTRNERDERQAREGRMDYE